jgi:hypothetical protein
VTRTPIATFGLSAVRLRNSSMAPVFSLANSRTSAAFLGFLGRPALFGEGPPFCHGAGAFVSLAAAPSVGAVVLSSFSCIFLFLV